MNEQLLRIAAETAGLRLSKHVYAPSEWVDEERPWSWVDSDPALPAFVASLLVEKVIASDKSWAYELSRNDGYGATCWEAKWSRGGKSRIIVCECLFWEPEGVYSAHGGQHVLPGLTHIWCRGSEDDEPFCGREEVEIRAALAALGVEVPND